MKLLDRYVLRNFIEPFLLCFCGFLIIWIVFDISDNSSDFIEAHASAKVIAGYYWTQLPQYTLVCMPVGLLLGLLYCLSRMSRTNEIVSMHGIGRSVLRVLFPLFAFGVAMTAFCLFLNWEYAPHSIKLKRIAMDQIHRKKRVGEVEPIPGHLFRDRLNNRTWFVKRLRPPSKTAEARFDDLHVTQQEPDGRITCKWYASRASYNDETHTWRLDKGRIVKFTPEGDQDEVENFTTGFKLITDWSETPWRVASSELDPKELSVPELRDYLRYNSDFPAPALAAYRANLADRFALPLTCFLVVLIGAPLGIVYKRGGVAGAVAGAIVIFFGMIMAHGFFMAMGQGMRMNPSFAPWMPDLILGGVGGILLWFRSANRDLPNPETIVGRAAYTMFFGVLLAGIGGYYVAQNPRFTGPIWQSAAYDCVFAGLAMMLYGYIRSRTKLKTA